MVIHKTVDMSEPKKQGNRIRKIHRLYATQTGMYFPSFSSRENENWH